MKARLGEARRTYDLLIQGETDDCLLWPWGRDTWGYGTVKMNGKMRKTHVLACEARHGPKPFPEAQAAHSCRNKHCMNYRHLRWATPKENHDDKVRDGTDGKGERSWRAKLTSDQVHAIREAHLRGARNVDLARRYEVHKTTIADVVRRRSWTHI